MSVPSRLVYSPLEDQSIAMCITPKDLIFPFYNIQRTNYFRPWQLCSQNMTRDIGSTIMDDTQNFKICLDVEHFLANEIDVKVSNNEIIITGAHEERQDEHCLIARKFTRRYILPRDCSSENVSCTLSSDNILTITAPKQTYEGVKVKEKNVPVKICGAFTETENIHQRESSATNKSEQTSFTIGEVNSNQQGLVKLKKHDYFGSKPEFENAYSAFREVTKTVEQSRSEFDAEVDEIMNAHSDILAQAKRVVSEFLEESLGSSNTSATDELSNQMDVSDIYSQQCQTDTLNTLETFRNTDLAENSSTHTVETSGLFNTRTDFADSSDVIASETNEFSSTHSNETSINNIRNTINEDTVLTQTSAKDEHAYSAEHFEESLKQASDAMSSLCLTENAAISKTEQFEETNTSSTEGAQQINLSSIEKSDQLSATERLGEISASTIGQSEKINVSGMDQSEQISTSTTSQIEQSSTSTMDQYEQMNTSIINLGASTSNTAAVHESLHEVSASMKATTEELNDFISDVIAELREATENI